MNSHTSSPGLPEKQGEKLVTLKSYFKHLGHVSLYHEFPNHKTVLSHGKNAIVQLSEAKKFAYVLLEMFGGEFVIISPQEEQGSAIWFYLIQQGIRNKFKFAGYYTCDPVALKTFASNTLDNRIQKSTDKNKNDNQVFNDIVNNSEPIDWFRSVVMQCIQLKASDIHFEVRADVATLRIRRDGLMRDVGTYDESTVTQAISAVYTLLAEERSRSEVAFNLNAPQSAVIPLIIQNANYGLRYQSHPAVSGYDVIMRVLKTDVRVKNNDHLSINKLGFTSWQVATLNEALGTANGGVFVAGITGSGKTTTLSSLLTQLAATGDRKIISIEDPVEYQIPGVSHLSVQRAAGNENSDSNPFASSMMAFLRMDPDIGMFGEIRDSMSAQIAYTAIQTGHKLLTTVHATSALGIIARLTSSQIGLNRSDICRPEFISALVYQSLIPKNCMHCRVKAEEVMDVASLLVYESAFYLDTANIYVASDHGCKHCRPEHLAPIKGGHAGIDGVTVAAEVIDPDLQLLEFLSNNQDIKAYEYWRNLQNTSFSSPEMLGKPAWGHALYGMSTGMVDPYYFEKIFGSPNKLKVSLSELNIE